jgi:hypothetical protein
MANSRVLGPAELVDAFRSAAAVLADHAAALDALSQDDRYDDSDSAVEAPAMESVDVDGVGPGARLAATLARAAANADASEGIPTAAESLALAAEGPGPGAPPDAAAILLAALAESVRNADRLDAERFALALEIAAERLAPGDDGVHAGGLPAVVAAAAEGALRALDGGAGLGEVVVTAADDGLTELEAGPEQNPDLVERGVVDASAAGFLLILDVLASVVTGEPLPAPPLDPVLDPAIGPAMYRVSCLLEPDEGNGLESAAWLESQWFQLGDLQRFEAFLSPWRMTLLTREPGRAIEALFGIGRAKDLEVSVVADRA